jgi:hypothetical protein
MYMFSIESVDFLNNLLSFDFNTAKQICLSLHVFDFQKPSEHQTEQIFLPHHFFKNKRLWEEVNGECHEEQKRTHHEDHLPKNLTKKTTSPRGTCSHGPRRQDLAASDPVGICPTIDRRSHSTSLTRGEPPQLQETGWCVRMTPLAQAACGQQGLLLTMLIPTHDSI